MQNQPMSPYQMPAFPMRGLGMGGGMGRMGGAGMSGGGSGMMAQTMRMGMNFPQMGINRMQSPFPMVPYGSPGTMMPKMGAGSSQTTFLAQTDSIAADQDFDWIITTHSSK